MYVPCDRLDVFERRHRQDPVSQVEDVSRTSPGARQHVIGRREDALNRSEQDRRIEVTLNRPVRADRVPCLVEWNAPVGADDVAAGGADSWRIAPVPTPK